MMFPKEYRWASPLYLAWIRKQPFCCCCGENGTTDDPIIPHHIKGVGHLSGGGLKAGDNWAMPMKASHHVRWHQHPNYDIQWEWVARVLAVALVDIAEGRLTL